MPGRRAREVVVITGATAGVGRATVREFASRGADIALLARGLDFDGGARSRSPQLWATEHRGWIAAAAAAAAIGLAFRARAGGGAH